MLDVNCPRLVAILHATSVRPTDLPPLYYHDHFEEMLSFVAHTYGQILSDGHREFVTKFSKLPLEARCLFVRMVNRRGAVFRLNTLRYAEILDVGEACKTLIECGFAGPLAREHFCSALSTMTKDELLVLARHHALKDIRISWPKSKLVQALHACVPFDSILIQGAGFIVQHRQEDVEFLLFLYFGKTHQSLTGFALRDLGIVSVSKRTTYQSRFETSAEANDCFRYSRILSALPHVADDNLDDMKASISTAEVFSSAYAMKLREQCAFALGRRYEKIKQIPAAISAYRLQSSAEGDERLVRLLYACGDKAAAKDMLIAMIDDPATDDEYSFASDFLARKFEKQRTSNVTALLREATTIWIDDAYRTQPEEGTAAYFRREGWTVYHTENALWRCLFGLVFWDELFGPDSDLHSSFDRMPSSLRDNSFCLRFEDRLSAKLSRVQLGEGMPIVIDAVATANREPNALFAWNHVDLQAIEALLACADGRSIAAILHSLASDYGNTCDGFPDIMMTKAGELRFCEIKAEGDVIRRNQMSRLRMLRDAGMSAEVLRVSFRYDCNQAYVVVDIETTGSRATGERITEIGAVKVCDGRVIDEWHSLINPQRSIPPFITKLTGITNSMVVDAPIFEEIADSFAAVMKDAIFVAHSVNFDHGFLAEEYRKLDRTFRHPKFCTCAEMRRHFRGFASYSLAALCTEFQISLVEHHRALADARAAAGLLNVINKRRKDMLAERATLAAL